MLAMDFTEVSSEEITAIAGRLIDKGLASVCAWGPSCEKAHDAFDSANISWEEETGKEFLVMSTWHSNETLEEALDYALFYASIAEDIWEKTSTVCVTMANSEWQKIMEKCLSDIEGFHERMVDSLRGFDSN